jgi:hypothetical protein
MKVLLYLCWLVFAISPLTTLKAQNSSVSADVQAELVKIEEATTFCNGKSSGEVADALDKFSLPQYTAMVDGKVLDRAAIIQATRYQPHPPSDVIFRDRVYLAQDQTVIVYGYYDWLLPKKGATASTITARFVDVFVQTPDGWRGLMSIVETPATTGPTGKPEEKPKTP